MKRKGMLFLLLASILFGYSLVYTTEPVDDCTGDANCSKDGWKQYWCYTNNCHGYSSNKNRSCMICND